LTPKVSTGIPNEPPRGNATYNSNFKVDTEVVVDNMKRAYVEILKLSNKLHLTPKLSIKNAAKKL
jgi:hypothetical protein